MGRHCSRSERNIMKKSKRDLIFSILSVFLIAFLMFAEISSGMAIYADTFNNNGAMPNENNGGIDGDIDNDMSGIGNGSADNGNGNLNESGNTATDGSDNSGNDTSANTGDKNTDNMGMDPCGCCHYCYHRNYYSSHIKKEKNGRKKEMTP